MNGAERNLRAQRQRGVDAPAPGRPSRAPRPRRRLTRLGLGALAAGGALLVLPSSARAETRLSVDAGWDGRYRPGHAVPVRIEVRADRLIQGTLTVSAGDGTDISLRVEVPGGSVKEYLLVVPTSPFDDEATVRASLRAGDEQARGEAEVEFDPAEELVGLLPAVTPADLPPALPLVGESGTARFVAIDDDALTTAAGSLAGLGTLVAAPDEIARLTADTRQAVLAWVNAGGHLLIDAQPGTEITGLPEPWQPGARPRVTAGMGEIRLTAGAATAGRWSDIVEPTPNVAGEDLRVMLEQGPFGFNSIGDGIARDAGLRVATPGWLLAFLIAYVVLAGPVTWIVLRAVRRPGLAWVAVPLVAVVFASASFVIGSDLRSGTRAAQGTVVVTSPAGAMGTTFVGSVSKNGGDADVTFPASWTLGAIDQSFFGGDRGAVSVAINGERANAVVPLDAGEFGLVRGQGAIAFEGGLEIEATAIDDEAVSGTVRNTTELTLEEVGVFVGRHGKNIGALGPGEEADFDIDAGRNADPWEPVENQVWSDALGWNTGRPDPDSVVNINLWNDARQAGPNFLASGAVVAAGWTRDLDVPARADDRLDGRAVIIGRGAVAGLPDRINPLAVHQRILRTGQGAENVADAFDVGGDFTGHLISLTVPDGTPSTGTELTAGSDVSGVQLWRGDRWETIDDQTEEFDPNFGCGGGPGGRRSIPLPDGAMQDGTVVVRILTNFCFGPALLPQLELHSQEAAA